jgi:predicted XRE-type DNA-binding protein
MRKHRRFEAPMEASMRKTTRATTRRGSGNIFADLGLPNADEHMLKARVVMFIGQRIEQLELTQQAAAKKMGISQPDVSNVLRGRFEGFSLERLLGFVRALGSDVEIRVKRPANGAKRKKHEGRMSLMMS